MILRYVGNWDSVVNLAVEFKKIVADTIDRMKKGKKGKVGDIVLYSVAGSSWEINLGIWSNLEPESDLL